MSGNGTMQPSSASDSGLSQSQGDVLLRLARRTIGDRLGMTDSKNDELEQALKNDIFQIQRATFVTLTIDGQLRGCIGTLTAIDSLAEGIQRNAINAAFNDPRFSSLTPDEFKKITIEVSILSEPKRLEYTDGDDLISKLRVNVDGVIIRSGSASATFLPQVWEQLPYPEQFLGHLCMKAGLSTDTWKSGQLEVHTYQVQYFEEHK
jgi:AmmeMemoRadiSam system protein A